jgi:hypothetical protein
MRLASWASCWYSLPEPGAGWVPVVGSWVRGGGFCALSCDTMPPTTDDACSGLITDGALGIVCVVGVGVPPGAGVAGCAGLGRDWLSASLPSATKKSPAFSMPLTIIQIASNGILMPSQTPLSRPLTKPNRNAGLAPLMILAILFETLILVWSSLARTASRKPITPDLSSGHSGPSIGSDGMPRRKPITASSSRSISGGLMQSGSQRHAQPARMPGMPTGLTTAVATEHRTSAYGLMKSATLWNRPSIDSAALVNAPVAHSWMPLTPSTMPLTNPRAMSSSGTPVIAPSRLSAPVANASIFSTSHDTPDLIVATKL